jgi:hypothetical protein
MSKGNGSTGGNGRIVGTVKWFNGGRCGAFH